MRDWLRNQFGLLLRPRSLVFGSLAGVLLLAGFVWQLPDRNLHVVVCDVGQGDAVLLTRGITQILVDGGPNENVLKCLTDHLPFWDRTLEVVILTHPEADHLRGLTTVLERYTTEYFVTGLEGNNTAAFKMLLKVVAEKNIPVRNIFSGDSITADGLRGLILWPDRNWVADNLVAENKDFPSFPNGLSAQNKSSSQIDQLIESFGASANGVSLGGGEMGKIATGPLNQYGLVLRFIYGNFAILLMADVDSSIDRELLNTGLMAPVTVLKVPHHGSRTGMTIDFLEAASPKLAVISVGRGNSYGHPAKEILDLLSTRGIQYKRTDVEGEIEIVSDGRNWWLVNK